MFVVSQVDGDGYVLSDAFVIAESNFYTEESLKTLAKQIASDCVTEANAYGKSKCKSLRI